MTVAAATRVASLLATPWPGCNHDKVAAAGKGTPQKDVRPAAVVRAMALNNNPNIEVFFFCRCRNLI